MAKRRGHGEGTIKQRNDGRWEGRISLGWKDGKRHAKSVYGATQEEVAKQLRRALVDRDSGKNIDDSAVPAFSTFAAGWLETVRPTLKPSSLKFYDDNLRRHILPTLGPVRLTDIRRRAVLRLIRALRQKDLATLTIRGVVRTLSACLSGAVDEQYLDSNPALGLRKYLRLGNGETHEPDPLSVEESARLVETARAQFSRWTPFVLCGLRSGLRLSELLALDWTDLGVVDVSAELLQALRVYRRALRVFALKHGRPAPSIMFPAVGGVERLDESNVRKVFTRLCTAAQVRPRSPHDMRDTFASQLLSKNAPLLYVAHQLGHSNAAVTLKHYAKWLPKADRRYVHLLDCGSTVGQPTADQSADAIESA